MFKIIRLTVIILLSLLITTCDSGGDGSGSGGWGGFSSEPGFDNNASNNTTGQPNEVVLTVKVNSRSFDVDDFIIAIADDLNCSVDQISITNTQITNQVAYIAFVFVEGNIDTDTLISDIQDAMDDGALGGYEAMIIIANMDEELCDMNIDCAGICNGDTIEDACGDCGGDSSSCNADNLIGLYQVYNFKLYNNVNVDGTCSGNLIDQLNGPIFSINDSYSYGNNNSCDYANGIYQATFRQYAQLNSDGTFLRFNLEDESEDSWEYCYDDNWYDCSNSSECSYCYSGSDVTDDIWLSVGDWNIDGEQLLIGDNNIEMSWEYGTYITQQIVCGGSVDGYSEEYNGCLDIDYDDHHDSEYESIAYEKIGNKLYVHDIDYDYYYGYGNDYYSNIECTKIELREITSWPSVGGCTDPFSDNYNPIATYDDDSCGEGFCSDNYYRQTQTDKHRNQFINND